MGRVNGKVAIIVGATAGIGKATVSLLAKEGAKVVFTGRREEVGKKVEEEIAAQGGEVKFLNVMPQMKKSLKH